MLKMRGKSVPGKIILTLCIASFLAGTLFTRHTWPYAPLLNEVHFKNHEQKMSLLSSKECDRKRVSTQNLNLHLYQIQIYF